MLERIHKDTGEPQAHGTLTVIKMYNFEATQTMDDTE